MTSSLHGPYRLGYTCATMVITKRGKNVSWSKTKKIIKSGLFSATREYEVGIASNRKSERYGEKVPGSCTYRPSRSGNYYYLKYENKLLSTQYKKYTNIFYIYKFNNINFYDNEISNWSEVVTR